MSYDKFNEFCEGVKESNMRFGVSRTFGCSNSVPRSFTTDWKPLHVANDITSKLITVRDYSRMFKNKLSIMKLLTEKIMEIGCNDAHSKMLHK